MEGVIDRIPWHQTEIEFEETIAGAEWEGDDGMCSRQLGSDFEFW